jgi:hypothetical protein
MSRSEVAGLADPVLENSMSFARVSHSQCVRSFIARSAALWLALAACACSGGDGSKDELDGSRREDASTLEPAGDAARERDAALESDAGYVPPDDTLPPLPSPAPSDAGTVSPVFFGPDNPVVYLNDYPRSVYTDGYVFALAANREIDLRGVISSGNDCMCSAADNYPVSNTPATRTAWIAAAREAGFEHIPDNTDGTQGPALQEPPSGRVTDTARIGSAGSDLIVREARLATPERPLLIVAGGGLTTLADAYLADPSITRRIVVSVLVGLSVSSLDDGNGRSDAWAAQLIMRSFRVFVFPSALDPPYTPEARMLAEFPDTSLRATLLNAGYYHEDYDSDGQPAVTVMLPSFVQAFERRALGPGLTMVDNPRGNLWVMTKGDPIAGGNEFFRALNKAFRSAADAGLAVATDAGADGGTGGLADGSVAP